MVNGKISVIVPIYNGMQYIPHMITSLKNQTYKNFEVILVEDHSTDGSKEFLKNIEKKDPRFIVVEPSEKMGTAVKGQEYGLLYCIGDYHFFLSQDDFIDSDLFEKCIEKFERFSADVVLPNCILFDEISDKKLGDYPIGMDYSSTLDSQKAFVLSLSWKIHGFSMERMDLFKKVGLKAEYYNSEEYYKRILFLKAKKIMFADSNFYYRQNNPNAITKSRKYIHVDILKTDLLLYKQLKINGFDKSIRIERLKSISKEYLKWYFRIFRYNLWYKCKFYSTRMLLSLFFPICYEWLLICL